MKWTKSQIRQRYPVWDLLSEFWLDTSFDASDLHTKAIRLKELGYSYEQVVGIALFEVAPAVRGNILTVAGEWSGLEGRWLRRRILKKTMGPLDYLHPTMFARMWGRLDKRYLDASGWAVIEQAMRTA